MGTFTTESPYLSAFQGSRQRRRYFWVIRMTIEQAIREEVSQSVSRGCLVGSEIKDEHLAERKRGSVCCSVCSCKDTLAGSEMAETPLTYIQEREQRLSWIFARGTVWM